MRFISSRLRKRSRADDVGRMKPTEATCPFCCGVLPLTVLLGQDELPQEGVILILVRVIHSDGRTPIINNTTREYNKGTVCSNWIQSCFQMETELYPNGNICFGSM